MKRRVIAAVTAVLFAAVSAVVLVRYTAGADERAMAGMQPVTVYVVTAPVPEGTPAEDLTDLITEKSLPTTAVATGAVKQLSAISGRVANTELQPGEQLLTSRFSDPESLKEKDEVEIPEGHEQLSLLLDPQRVLGGHLKAGDHVGVFTSLGDNVDDGRTHLTLHRVLVSRVQGAVVPAPAESGGAAAQTTTDSSTGEQSAAAVPEGAVIVTLAVTAPDAEKLVFAAEYGQLWLSLEDEDSSTSGTRVVTEENEHS